MTIERIAFEDFPKRNGGHNGGRPRTEEGEAIRALQPGEALRFDCRWGHHHGVCGAHSMVWRIEQRDGLRLQAACRDNYFYVKRTA